MEKGTEQKTLAWVAECGIGDIIDRCVREPEQRRFWWGYDLESGGRLYIEYRRGKSVPEVGDTFIQHFSED